MTPAERVARQLCIEAGHDPDAKCIPYRLTEFITPAGVVHCLAHWMELMPMWMCWKRVAEVAIEAAEKDAGQ